MESAMFVGDVIHHRYAPRDHAFRYPLFMMYFDLDELEDPKSPLHRMGPLAIERPGIVSFRSKDYLKDRAPGQSLAAGIRDLVETRTGKRPEGPVRLLTHPRYFGYVLNPLSLFYCFDVSGERVETVVAEVSNTPWGERHHYVLHLEREERRHRFDHPKTFHVSPFMEMDMRYHWNLTEPGESLAVAIANHKPSPDGRTSLVFDAALKAERVPLTRSNLLKMLARFPFMTAKVAMGIYWQALRLFLKRIPFISHPGKKLPEPEPCYREIARRDVHA